MKKIKYDYIPREVFESWVKSVKFLQSWESIDREKSSYPKKTTAELFGEKLFSHIFDRINSHKIDSTKVEPLKENQLKSDLKVLWDKVKVKDICIMTEDTFNGMHKFGQNKINKRIDWINENLKETYLKDTS